MATVDLAKIKKLQTTLESKDVAMSKRMRTIFTLRGIATKEAIDALKGSLNDESVLLGHEIAYCLGQICNPYAVPALVDALKNVSLHPMVRHEAAEALGAIGGPEAKEVLLHFKDDEIPEIRDTCRISLGLIDWKTKNQDKSDLNSHPVFMSVDPAPAEEEKNLDELREQLLNREIGLFERYKAMFALRNLGNEKAIKILGEALTDKESGAVFTHEVAYVLGQLQDKMTIPVLQETLKDVSLNCMVRHEAAEALGSIADQNTVEMLKKFTADPEEPVKESCFVALDILDYFNSDNFQYADGLEGEKLKC